MQRDRSGYSLGLFFLLSVLIACGQAESEFKWPDGAKAAICLTYDDGLSSHIKSVAPMLKKYNFPGTFFVTLSSASINRELDQWKALSLDGHELGNHTLYHPCRKSLPGMEWVEEHLDLDHYTLRKIREEIRVANTFLQALDGKTTRTFAYPCGHFHAGGINFKDSISAYATAARDASEFQTELPSPEKIDLNAVPSWAPNGHGANELIAYIEKVMARGTLSSFTFHGVGADHMAVSADAHEKMLKYLDAHRKEIWVTTFQEATNYLKSTRGKE